MSQVRFQADWNLHHIIAQAAQRREPTLDFQTARAANPLSVSDLDVLERAAREGTAAGHARFPRYAPAFCRLCPGTDECRCPLVPQRLPVAAVAEDLLLIWAATEAEDWHTCITSLPL